MFRIPISPPRGVLPTPFYVESIPLTIEYAVTVSSSRYDETINLHWSVGQDHGSGIRSNSLTYPTQPTPYMSDIAFLKNAVLRFQNDGAHWLTLELFANAVSAFEEAAGVKTNIGNIMRRNAKV